MNAVTFDITSLLAGLMSCDHKVHAALERGMGKAGSRLLRDATIEPPTVPKLVGHLRGSGSVTVNGKHIQGQDNGASETPEAGAVTVEVGFNSPYAAYQHEGVRKDGTHEVKHYTTEGSGKKFLETPLLTKSEEYMGIAANEVRRALA